MIQRFESSHTTWLVFALLLFSIVLIGACSGEEVVDQPVQTESEYTPLPVREWYPASKYAQPASPYTAPVAQYAPLTMPPTGPGMANQLPAQEYNSMQPVYQPPQPQPYYQPGTWTTLQPVVTAPATAPTYWYQSPAQPRPQVYYQYVPRPWGNQVPPDPNRDVITTDAWPQGGYTSPWGTPPAGTANSAGTEQHPWSVYPGHVW